MTLMKYSFDFSNPWLTKYYGKENCDCEKQSFGDNRNIFQSWINRGGKKLLDIFSINGRHSFPHEYGLVSFINTTFLTNCPTLHLLFPSLLYSKALIVIAFISHLYQVSRKILKFGQIYLRF